MRLRVKCSFIILSCVLWGAIWLFARAIPLQQYWAYSYPAVYAMLGIDFLLLAGGLLFGNRTCIRISVFLNGTMLLLATCGFLVWKYDWFHKFRDVATLKAFLGQYGKTSALVFIVVQFLQVTIIPIPSAITTVAGVALFGLWKTVLYSTVGIVAGSMFAFWLGRKAGVRLVVWMCGESAYAKYRSIAEGKDRLILTLMFLFPLFPDDLLCLVAGMTDFTYRGFFLTMLWTRPIGILSVAGALNGAISIPITGWGIPVWIALIAVLVALFFVFWKYGDRIRDKIAAIFGKLSARVRRNQTDEQPAQSHSAADRNARRSEQAYLQQLEIKRKRYLRQNSEPQSQIRPQ